MSVIHDNDYYRYILTMTTKYFVYNRSERQTNMIMYVPLASCQCLTWVLLVVEDREGGVRQITGMGKAAYWGLFSDDISKNIYIEQIPNISTYVCMFI